MDESALWKSWDSVKFLWGSSPLEGKRERERESGHRNLCVPVFLHLSLLPLGLYSCMFLTGPSVQAPFLPRNHLYGLSLNSTPRRNCSLHSQNIKRHPFLPASSTVCNHVLIHVIICFMPVFPARP